MRKEVIGIKTPVSRVGNKTAILPILYALFPLKYGRFIDVFGGSGSVLLGKPTIDSFEVYNDFDRNLVNLFHCMKERTMATMQFSKASSSMAVTHSGTTISLKEEQPEKAPDSIFLTPTGMVKVLSDEHFPNIRAVIVLIARLAWPDAGVREKGKAPSDRKDIFHPSKRKVPLRAQSVKEGAAAKWLILLQPPFLYVERKKYLLCPND